MKKIRIIHVIMIFVFLAAGCGETEKEETKITADSSAEEAVLFAKNTGAYSVLLFYNEENDAFKIMEEQAKNVIAQSGKNIFHHNVLTTEKKNSAIVEKYNMNNRMLPALLVMAPNGALSGLFNRGFSNEQLAKSFVPELTGNILKILQDNKIAVVLLQNSSTKNSIEALTAANAFAKNPRLKTEVQVVKADPNNPDTKDFLDRITIKEDVSESVTVLLVPPDSIAGVYRGKIEQSTLENATAQANPQLIDTGKAEQQSSDFSNLPDGIKAVFIEIGSDSCVPCQMMQPIMKEIEEEYGDQVKIVFYDVWTPEGKPYGAKYNIRVIPTQVFLDAQGKEYFRHEGFFPKEELVKVLKQQGVK